MRIEEITAESISVVSDAELRNLRFRFIQLWSKMKDPEKQREYLKRYKDLISEFDRRHLTRGRYPIDEALENYERSKGLSAGYSDLVVIPEFVSIVGSFVKTPAEARDIDILIRQVEQDEGLERKLMKVVEETGLAPHFVYEPAGPHSSYIPLFDLVLRSRPFEVVEVAGDEIEQAAAQISSAIESYESEPPQSETKKFDEVNFDTLGKYPLPKPAMAGVTEARSVESIAGWCEGRTFVAEPKLNGYRVSIGKSGDKLKIISDGLENRVDSFPPEFVEYLRSVPHDFIIDSDVGIELDGKRLPRVQLARLNASQVGLDESERLVVVVFDLIWLDGEDLHLEPFEKRRQRLVEFASELKDGKNFRFELVPESPPMTSTKELERWFNKFSRLPQSEGIVVKDVTGIYPLNGVWDSVAKLKNAAEFKVIVLSAEKTKDGNSYVYEVGVLPGEAGAFNITEFNGQEYINLGHTMASSIEAKPGDILTIRALEIIPLTDPDNRLVFQNASVVDVDPSRKTPYFADQVIDIAREYNVLQVEKAESNIDFEAGDKGRGCLQLHIMGLSEDEAKALKSAEPGVLVARLDIKKLREKLLSVIGNHGCHLDLRLVREGDDYFEGAEIFVGNIDGLSKFVSLDEGEKLRADFKVAQVDEPQVDVVRGPDDWLNIGARSIAVFEPGEVGAFSKTWAAMVRLDSFRWELYLAETHAKKFRLEDRYLSGNYLFAYVPVSANERVWMLSKLKDEDYEEETKALEVAKARQPFGSPGGKSRSAELIVSYLPEHKTYVEPFAGGAAVFWKKDPSELEVLNDKNPEVAFAYRFIKSLTPEKIERLKKFDWISRRKTFNELLSTTSKASSDEERFYRFFYTLRASYRYTQATVSPGHLGRSVEPDYDHLLKAKERLKNVKILNKDYKDIISEFNASDTFFFLDPPYPGEWAGKDFGFDIEELEKELKKIKGQFMLTLNDCPEHRRLFSDYVIKKIEVTRIYQPGKTSKVDPELIITNYPFRLKKELELEEKDYEVKLIKGSAADGDEHIVTGVVYEPEKVDAQGEYTDAEEIREACYRFMEAGAKFKLNHSGEPLDCVKLLENYIAPVSFEVNGEKVKKGSWLMTLRVLAPDLWADIKSGKISGLSMAGYAYVEPAAKPGA